MSCCTLVLHCNVLVQSYQSYVMLINFALCVRVHCVVNPYSV